MKPRKTYRLKDLESATELDSCIYFTRLGVQPDEVITMYRAHIPEYIGYYHISVHNFSMEFFEEDERTYATLRGLLRLKICLNEN